MTTRRASVDFRPYILGEASLLTPPMASSLSGGAGNDLVIPDDAPVTITAPSANDGTAVVDVVSSVSDINLKVGGDAPVKVEGATVKNSVVRPAAAAGETAEITFETKKLQSVTIVNEGEGAVAVDVAEGTFKKSTIDLSTGTAKDSIAFGGDTKIVKNDILLGAGKDTVTFSEGVKLKGDTKIQVGDGRDAIKVPSEVKGGGMLLISNFSTKDRLVVDGKKISGNKLYKEKKDAPDFIAIQFEDGKVIG